MSKEKQIEEMAKVLCEDCARDTSPCVLTKTARMCESVKEQAEALYNAGYRKQNDEELIDKIATYFEEEENWERLMRGTWNVCGNSVQLRDMLRDAICGAKLKGDAE